MRAVWAIRHIVFALLLLAPCAPAEAGPAFYSWVPLSASGEVSGNPVGVFSLGSVDFASALAGNHFSFSAECSGAPCPTGFSDGNFGGVSIQRSGAYGGMDPIVFVDIDVIFNGDGTLSGHIHYFDTGTHFVVSGSGDAWDGQFNSDSINCDNPNPCQATGYWFGGPIEAPEPFTVSLFGAGIAGAAALRRKRSP